MEQVENACASRTVMCIQTMGLWKSNNENKYDDKQHSTILWYTRSAHAPQCHLLEIVANECAHTHYTRGLSFKCRVAQFNMQPITPMQKLRQAGSHLIESYTKLAVNAWAETIFQLVWWTRIIITLSRFINLLSYVRWIGHFQSEEDRAGPLSIWNSSTMWTASQFTELK